LPHSSKTLALIANGAINNYQPLYPQILACDEVVAVDGGLLHCRQMDIQPQLILGDFDSIDTKLLNAYEGVPRKTFSIEKDETDLELAVAYGLEKGFQRILLFAALGKRLDHSLNNLFLLGRYPKNLTVVTEDEVLFVIEGDKVLELEKGQVISLLPLFGDAIVSTKGLKWNLDKKKLNYRFLSQSNVAISNSVSIEVNNGLILCTLHQSSSLRGSNS